MATHKPPHSGEFIVATYMARWRANYKVRLSKVSKVKFYAT